jgi:phage protein D/phage baseplate assembly protein gpV
MDLNALASQIHITLNGSDVPQAVITKLDSVIVDQHAHLPDMFEIKLHDPGLQILDNGPFDLTKEVEISAEKSDGTKVVLMKGEITALEPQFTEGMVCDLVIRGYDKLHRLFRETKSKAYVNVKDSDLANQIAQSTGLQPVVDTTSIVFDHIFQHNQSDLAFLMKRAWRIGFECFISEGKLYFRKPPSGTAAVTLTWGEELLSFMPRMTLSEQVDEVIVKGWDVDKKAAIVGKATSGNLYPQIGESKDGAGWAHQFGSGKLIIVNQPVTNQSEADTLAAARLDEISGAFVDAEGVAFRRPDITAGQMVKIEALGQRFSGTYLVTHCTHVYNAAGFTTTFTVNGLRTGLLSEEISPGQPSDHWPGLVPAIVTNSDDPQDWGRIKVKFPWLDDNSESFWARVIGIGAGPEAGYYVMPSVGDEVMVAFLHGDFSQPIILGGVWNGANKIPPEAASAGNGEKPLVRTWHSVNGHKITMYDNADKKIEIATIDGRSIVLDDNNKKILISTDNAKITVDDNNVTLETSGGNVKMKSGSNFTMESGGNIDIKASGNVTIKGATINLNP